MNGVKHQILPELRSLSSILSNKIKYGILYRVFLVNNFTTLPYYFEI